MSRKFLYNEKCIWHGKVDETFQGRLETQNLNEAWNSYAVFEKVHNDSTNLSPALNRDAEFSDRLKRWGKSQERVIVISISKESSPWKVVPKSTNKNAFIWLLYI